MVDLKVSIVDIYSEEGKDRIKRWFIKVIIGMIEEKYKTQDLPESTEFIIGFHSVRIK